MLCPRCGSSLNSPIASARGLDMLERACLQCGFVWNASVPQQFISQAVELTALNERSRQEARRLNREAKATEKFLKHKAASDYAAAKENHAH